MHIGAALDAYRRRARVEGAGVGAPSSRGLFRLCCFPCALLAPEGRSDHGGHKFLTWCLLALLVCSAVLCIGRFEAMRLTTHVLRSPCTIVGSEFVDVGTCRLCDEGYPANCEVHPIATARLSVTFRPLHAKENITGWVWYCKGRDVIDPCRNDARFLDQMSLDLRQYGQEYAAGGPVSCTAGQVFAYMQLRALEGDTTECYYSSRDPTGEDVWLSMPSVGLVDHAWFQKHLEYPLLLALGGLVLLSVLLGCLALEGAEIWASGLV